MSFRKRLEKLEATPKTSEVRMIEIWSEDPTTDQMVGPNGKRLSMPDYEAYRRARHEARPPGDDHIDLIEVRRI